MFKKFVSSLMICVLLVGCSSTAEESAEEETKTPTVIINTEKHAEKIVYDLGLEEKVTMIEARAIQGLFFFEEGVVENSTVYYHNDASADMVAVFQANDIEACESSISTFLETTKEQMQNYYPDEVFKVDNAVLEHNQNEVILVICDDLSNAKKDVEGILNH